MRHGTLRPITSHALVPTSAARAVRLALAVAAVGSAAAVQAQTVAPRAGDVTTLSTVTVTASQPISVPTPPTYGGGQVATGGQMGILGNLDTMSAPFSMSSFTSKLIQDQQARTLGEVVKNDPSVQVGNGFGNQAETFVIRGFELNNDDLSFNGLYGILPRQVLPMQMVERVEIFKGASGFLNGAAPGGSGLGGLINIQPKRATDDPITNFDIDYTSRMQLGGAVDIGRRWGESNQFGVRVNAAYRGDELPVDDAESTMGMGSIGLDFRGERLRLSVDAGVQEVRFDQPRPTVRLSGGDVPDAPDNDINYGQPWSYSRLESRYLVGRAEFDLNENWMTYAALGTSTDDEDGLYTSMSGVDGDGVGSQGLLRSPFRRDTTTGEVGLRGRFDTGPVGHRVNLSFSALKQINRTAFAFGTTGPQDINDPIYYPEPALGAPSGDLDDPNRSLSTQLRSVALSDTLSFMDERVLLTLGARHQNIDETGYDTSGARTATYDKSVVSPMAGLVVKPTHNLSLYANYIQGLTRGAQAPNDAVNAGELFSPERTKQVEAGAKLDFGDYGASLAVFQIERPEYGVEGPDDVFARVGEQRNRGVELNVYGEVVPSLRLIGGVTLMQAKLEGTADGVNDGNYAVGVPKLQAVLGAEYDLAALPGLTLQAHATHRGKQYVNADNEGRLPAWTRLDLGARYTTEIDGRTVTWRAGVDNVFDKDYWATVAPQFGQITAGYGRTYKASMSIAF